MPRQEIPPLQPYDALDLPEDVQYKDFRGHAIRPLKLAGVP
jgi:hypothetical protein